MYLVLYILCACTYMPLRPGDHDCAGRCQSLLGQSGPMTRTANAVGSLVCVCVRLYV